jgi:hypothetical protein
LKGVLAVIAVAMASADVFAGSNLICALPDGWCAFAAVTPGIFFAAFSTVFAQALQAMPVIFSLHTLPGALSALFCASNPVPKIANTLMIATSRHIVSPPS